MALAAAIMSEPVGLTQRSLFTARSADERQTLRVSRALSDAVADREPIDRLSGEAAGPEGERGARPVEPEALANLTDPADVAGLMEEMSAAPEAGEPLERPSLPMPAVETPEPGEAGMVDPTAQLLAEAEPDLTLPEFVPTTDGAASPRRSRRR